MNSVSYKFFMGTSKFNLDVLNNFSKYTITGIIPILRRGANTIKNSIKITDQFKELRTGLYFNNANNTAKRAKYRRRKLINVKHTNIIPTVR